MTPPPVTIGMPVYNGARFLAETLESILAQTFGDFELMITDNASSDATPDICRHYAADLRIRYYRHPKNLGAAVNYTSCFERSLSPFFKWAAHDDPWAPDLLEGCMTALTNHPDAVLAFARTLSIDADGRQRLCHAGTDAEPGRHQEPERGRAAQVLLDGEVLGGRLAEQRAHDGLPVEDARPAGPQPAPQAALDRTELDDLRIL